jgi:transcriptional regulator with XRE-family HTH domain
MVFTEKLKILLQFAHLARISAAAGLSPGTLSNIIYERTSPRADTMQKLALLLNVDLTWLMDPMAEFPAVKLNPRAIGSPLVYDPSKLPAITQKRLAELEEKANKADSAA